MYHTIRQTHRVTKMTYVVFFWGLVLSLFLFAGCKEIPVKSKSVDASATQEEFSSQDGAPEQQQTDSDATPNEPSLSLLVLYKSSEGNTDNGNIFFYHLQPFALAQHFQVTYHDIDKSFPSDKMMQNVDAIVSVFNGPVMKNAKDYIEWIAQQGRDTKKIIIIGNFGAYSPDGKEWYDGSVLNTFYHEMGLEFAGHWTNDPKIIEIASKDSSMIGDEADITPKRLTHYFLIKSLNPKNIIYLALKRKDMDDSESAVVVKTQNGGIAMENYVFTNVDGQAKKLLKLESFLAQCLQ